MKLYRELIAFGCIGVLGLAVDTTVLYAFKSLLGPFAARFFSFLAAVLTTWLLNRSITFRRRASKLPHHKEFFAYIGLMLIGGVANYACYTWLILTYQYVEANLFIGVAAGSLVGMLINYSSSKFFLFRKNSP